MLPSLESLRCFVEAARSRSFRSAGRIVALTPAAVGQRVHALEELLGIELFVRTPRHLILTPSGERFLPEALRVLETAEQAVVSLQGWDAKAPLNFTIGTRHELGMSWLVPALPRIQKLFPHTAIHLYFGSGDDLLAKLKSFTIDCAITSSRFNDARLATLQMHQEDYAFVGAPGLLAKNPVRHPHQAANHVLIDSDASLPLYRYWADAPGAHELGFSRILHMGSCAAVRDLVLRGLGVAVLPKYFIKSDLKSRRLRVIFPAQPLLCDHFRLIYRADERSPQIFRALAKSLLALPLR